MLRTRRVLASLSSIRHYAVSHAPVVLRPYQEACVQSCLDAISAGHSRIGVSSPTGSGKTTMFVSLIDRLVAPDHRPEANRSLIIVNSIELVRQTAESVRNLFPDMTVEIEQGQRHNASGYADVTVATYQTLLQPNRLTKFQPERMKAVIVDEAHHAAAPSYRRILSYFDPIIKSDASYGVAGPSKPTESSGVPIVGFSATFSRHDGLALSSVFDRIVYHQDFTQMIDDKWLSPVRFTSVKADIDLSSVTVNARSGDFNATSLSHVINTETVNTLVLHSWLDRAAGRKSTLVFCVNIAHVVDLTDTFRQAGVDARFLHSKTPAHERKTLLERFRAGQFPVLINCAILTEGADIPNVDCVIVARPTRSRNIFAQMIGRGMRLSPQTGKEDCHIIDFVDTLNRVDGVVSTPTLLGLEPSDNPDDEAVEILSAETATAADDGGFRSTSPAYNVPAPKSVTYDDYENPWSLADDASGSPYIGKMSQLAWVSCGRDVYVLECLRSGYVKIEQLVPKSVGDPLFIAHHFPVLHSVPASMRRKGILGAQVVGDKAFMAKRKILTADSIQAAIKGCDTYVTNKIMHGNAILGMFRSAKWRKEPATEGQKAVIRKRLHLDDADLASSPFDLGGAGSAAAQAVQQAKKPITLDTLTKGEAANILTRVFHGAMKHYTEKTKRQVKLADLTAKKLRKQEMQTVRVGPLPV